jgi:hypothetical protein
MALFLVRGVSYARWMNPATGRFQTMDSYDGRREEPLSLHRYLCAQADPVNRIDPTGRDGELGELAVTSAISDTIDGLSTPAFNAVRAYSYRAATYVALNLDTWVTYATMLGGGLEAAGYLIDASHSLINNTDTVPAGNFPRGRFIEDKAGANLRGNFGVIDDFRDGTATSWKSHKAASPQGLLQWITRDVDALDSGIKNAPNGVLKGTIYTGEFQRIPTSTIQAKVLAVAIPESQMKWLTAEFEASIRMLEQERETIIEVIPVGRWE